MRESKVERYFDKKAKEHGGETRKIKYINRHGATDRILLFDEAEFYWVELKAPKKKAAAHQKREHKRLRDRGHAVLVLDTIEKVDKFFTSREISRSDIA